MLRRVLSAVVVAGLLVAMAALPAGAHGTFHDDDANTHEADIEAIAEAAITEGCNPPLGDQYCPHVPVPRDQMAAFLARTLELPEAEQDHFTDDEGNPFEPAINRIADEGITKGCGGADDATYCPGATVSRDQMAAFLARAFDLPEAEQDHFTDDDGLLLEQSINRVAEEGITRGCDPEANRYCPHGLVDRDEMASFLARAQDLQAADPTPDDHDRVITYSVGTHGGPDDGSLDVLATRTHQALHSRTAMDRAGWNIQQRILFRPVASGGDVRVWLTDADDVGEQAPVCDDAYSCTVGNDAYINDDNFAHATQSWSHRPLPEYQRYVVVHEVGHVLNFDAQTHYNDPAYCAADGRAPVMMQQSIDRRGCAANVWPLGWERDCVEKTWLADRVEQGECPHPAG